MVRKTLTTYTDRVADLSGCKRLKARALPPAEAPRRAGGAGCVASTRGRSSDTAVVCSLVLLVAVVVNVVLVVVRAIAAATHASCAR